MKYKPSILTCVNNDKNVHRFNVFLFNNFVLKISREETKGSKQQEVLHDKDQKDGEANSRPAY